MQRLFAMSLSLFVWVAVLTSVPAESTDVILVRLLLSPDANLVEIAKAIEATGGRALTLTPEGTLPVLLRESALTSLLSVPGVESSQIDMRERPPAAPSRDPQALGDRPPTSEEQQRLDQLFTQVDWIEPNSLSDLRRQIAASVDNSLSVHFPPIRSQGVQNSCTAWAACYYYNTYTQAMDEGLDVSGGNNATICSPAFMYPLVNDGSDNGADTQSVVARLTETGCASWNLMPYSSADYLTWPTEEAWVEAMRYRTLSPLTIGGYLGCTDAEFEALKQHLANGHTAVTRTAIYQNWYGNYPNSTTGIDNAVLFASDGDYVGDHAMTIVGYDDDRPYSDGTSTHYGALLIANSWGTGWGTTNTGGSDTGFMWVAYDYFKANNGCFGVAYYCSDRDDYRPSFYATGGMNHDSRSRLGVWGGVGIPDSPDWESHAAIYADGGSERIGDDRRVAVDLTDGVASITDFGNIDLYVALGVFASAVSSGTISSADFSHDFDGDGLFHTISSTDPVLEVPPGETGYATLLFASDDLAVSPGNSYTPAGPVGGPCAPTTQTYTLGNSGEAALDWTVATTATWLSLSASGGTLDPATSDTVVASLTSETQSLTTGTHEGMLTFRNVTSGMEQERLVSLEIRPLGEFVWDAIPSPQEANTPFTVRLVAVDTHGTTVTSFDDTVALSGQVGATCDVGSGSGVWDYPFQTYYHDARTQVIYLAGELPAAGTLTSLALDVTVPPGQLLENWTIRLQHTALSTFPSAEWVAGGWTTVFQADTSVTSTGWVEFEFDTPFPYDGASNLLVDFSFNNSRFTQNGQARCSTPGGTRVVYYRSDSLYGDPLEWSGTQPAPFTASTVPDIRVGFGESVPVTPLTTGHFVAGAWTGAVTVPDHEPALRLVATDSAGPQGESNAFEVGLDVTPPSVPSVLRMSDNPTSASQVIYAVTFSESVSGVASGSFSLTVDGVAGAEVQSIAGGPAAYTVVVDTGTKSGFLRLDVVDDDTVLDAAGNPLGGAGSGNGDFSAGESYTISRFDPTEVWVDFDYDGPEEGTELRPFRTLGQGISAADPGAEIWVQGAAVTPLASDERLEVTKAVRIESRGGAARIGEAY